MTLPFRYQVAVALVGLNIVGTAALAGFAYRASRNSLENQATRAVGAVAQAREQALLQLLQRGRERMDAFLGSVEALCAERTGPGAYGWESVCVRTALKGFQTAERAAAADLQYGGRRLATRGPWPPPSDFTHPAQLAIVSRNADNAEYTMQVARGRLVLRVQFSLDDIEAIFRDRSGLEAGGEVFLTDEEGRPLTPLRYAIEPGHRVLEAPLKPCLAGTVGNVLATDYRGAEVMSGFRPIPAVGGGCIVANLQYAEALVPIHRLGRVLIFAAIGFIFIGVIVSLIVARAATQPIARLAASARALELGHFDHAVPISGPSEVQQLGRALSSMAHSLSELVQREHSARLATEATNRQMSHLAYHDTLTDLPNRLLLHDRLARAIAAARRHERRLGVLFVDVDRFKHMNDSLGHVIGDALLQSIAACLTACVRSSDTVARQGGDEFIVVLSEIEHEGDAVVTAGNIIAALAEPHRLAEHELHITVSVGVSVFPRDGVDAQTLIKNADIAMYYAKQEGRARLACFTPDMNVRAVERQSVEAGLHGALKREEFVVHYQPTTDLNTGAIIGAEALVRWRHPDRGLVLPSQFVAVAEDCGLIVPIGQWVLREACRQACAWRESGLPPLPMSVNVSAVEFRGEGFLERVREVLRETGLDPRYLVLELTEGVLVENADSTITVLRALKALGVGIAIDDFGTGYSSLSYLSQFPIDALKVDQSFVRTIGVSTDAAPIVRAVISMARSLNYRVIAEGVETSEQLTFLRDEHCGEGQGYYFSRPLEAKQFATLLRSRTRRGTFTTASSHT
jgi:diguanylate cyclase